MKRVISEMLVNCPAKDVKIENCLRKRNIVDVISEVETDNVMNCIKSNDDDLESTRSFISNKKESFKNAIYTIEKELNEISSGNNYADTGRPRKMSRSETFEKIIQVS